MLRKLVLLAGGVVCRAADSISNPAGRDYGIVAASWNVNEMDCEDFKQAADDVEMTLVLKKILQIPGVGERSMVAQEIPAFIALSLQEVKCPGEQLAVHVLAFVNNAYRQSAEESSPVQYTVLGSNFNGRSIGHGYSGILVLAQDMNKVTGITTTVVSSDFSWKSKVNLEKSLCGITFTYLTIESTKIKVSLWGGHGPAGEKVLDRKLSLDRVFREIFRNGGVGAEKTLPVVIIMGDFNWRTCDEPHESATVKYSKKGFQYLLPGVGTAVLWASKKIIPPVPVPVPGNEAVRRYDGTDESPPADFSTLFAHDELVGSEPYRGKLTGTESTLASLNNMLRNTGISLEDSIKREILPLPTYSTSKARSCPTKERFAESLASQYCVKTEERMNGHQCQGLDPSIVCYRIDRPISWTDRILHSEGKITSNGLQSFATSKSDHFPVYTTLMLREMVVPWQDNPIRKYLEDIAPVLEERESASDNERLEQYRRMEYYVSHELKRRKLQRPRRAGIYRPAVQNNEVSETTFETEESTGEDPPVPETIAATSTPPDDDVFVQALVRDVLEDDDEDSDVPIVFGEPEQPLNNPSQGATDEVRENVGFRQRLGHRGALQPHR